MTQVIFTQIEKNASQEDIIATIHGNKDFIDLKKTKGMFKDNLLTAALNNKMNKVALRLIEFGGKYNISHINSEENTPLLLAVSDVDMIDVVKALLKKKDDCDINYKTKDGTTAMTRILEVGNFQAFEELLQVTNLELEHYTINLDHVGEPIKVTLLEYILSNDLGADFSDNLQHARLLLEEKGMDCHPLHIIHNSNNDFKSTALTFSIGDYSSNVDDELYVVGKLLKFAQENGDKNYVNCETYEGNAALDLLFEYALQSDIDVDARILKLFVDYYYNNDISSPVFLRNIDKICSDEKLFKELKKLYPKSKKQILDDACDDIVETHVEFTNPALKTASPEIQTGKRIRSSRSDKKLESAKEIHFVNAIERENPLPLWAQVGDTRDRGIRQTKRWRIGGKRKNKKTQKHK